MTFPAVLENDDGIRPAGRPDQCYYCQQFVGQEHKADCVTVSKRVKVRYEFELEIEVPHHWTKEDIEFHRNESSWCSDNGIQDLVEYRERIEKEDLLCTCQNFACTFLEVTDDTPRVKEPRTA